MKRLLLIFTILLCFCSFNVYAENENKCSYSESAELNKMGYKVSVDYEIKDIGDNDYYFNINIYNLTSDLYVIITKDEEIQEEFGTKITYDMTSNGIYTFIDEDIYNITNYVFTIYSNTFNCNNTIRQIKLVKPMYNPYSNLDNCNIIEMKNYKYCEKWIDKEFDNDFNKITSLIDSEYKRVSKKNNICLECILNSYSIDEKYTKEKIIIFSIFITIFLINLVIIIRMIKKLRKRDDQL